MNKAKLNTLLKTQWVELCIFIVSLSTYAFTSSKSIVEGDTGDFLTAAASGGVPHPSGYPLYSLLTRIAYLLPFGHPIWQVNLSSALFGAIALIFVYKTIHLLTKNTPASLFGVLALGTYNVFWFYALVAQVHIFQVLVLSVLTYFLTLASKTKKVFYIYIAGFTFGCGVSTNHTIILFLPSFLCILWSFRKEVSLGKITKFFLFSSLGLLPYLYTLYSASTHAGINWDRITDVGSFLNLFFRRDYGSYFSTPEPPIPFQYYAFLYYFKNLFLTSWFSIPFALLGLVAVWKKNKEAIAVLLSFILFGPFFYLLTNTPIRFVVYEANVGQYFAYSFLFFSILCGVGVSMLLQKITFKHTFALSLLSIAFFTLPFVHTFSEVRQDNNRLTEVTTHFQLSEVPQHAVLLTWADGLYFPAMYWQYGEHYRTDITVIELSLFNLPWYRENLAEHYPFLKPLLTSSNFDYQKACDMFAKDNKLFLYPWYPEFSAYFQKSCTIIPYGLITKVVPTQHIPSTEKIKSFNDTAWQAYVSLLPSLTFYKDKYVRTRETLFNVAEHLSYTGLFYHQIGKDDWALSTLQLAKHVSPDEVVSRINESAILFQRGDAKDAIQTLEEGIQKAPATPSLYKNLGLIYMSTNQPDKAYQNFQTYLTFNPTDKDLPLINNFILNYNLQRRF